MSVNYGPKRTEQPFNEVVYDEVVEDEELVLGPLVVAGGVTPVPPGGPFSSYAIPTVATLAGEAWYPPPNGIDDTTAMETTYAAIASSIYKVESKFFWGAYRYNGSGLNGSDYNIAGMGSVGIAAGHVAGTTILLGAASWFLAPTVQLSSLTLRGLKVSGGLGAVHQTYAGSNVGDEYEIDRVTFVGYTQNAVGSLATDMPYWKLARSIFRAANSNAAIGVALAASPDQGAIVDCAFLENAVHIKLNNSGPNFTVERVDLIQFGPGTNRASIWVVPKTAAGPIPKGGLTVKGAKFGNENLDSSDFRVLYADELGGGDFTSQLPQLAADSTGRIGAQVLEDCRIYSIGSNDPPLVYTTTPLLYSCRYGPLVISGTGPSHIIKVRTVPVGIGGEPAIVGPISWPDGPATGASAAPQLSNAAGFAYAIDPQGILLDSMGVVL